MAEINLRAEIADAAGRLARSVRHNEIAEAQRADVQRRLRDVEERFRVTFERSPVAMAAIDRDARLLAANPAYAALLGYDREELATMDLRLLTHPDDRASTDAEVARLWSGDGPAVELDKRYVDAGGEVVWARTSISLVPGEEGDDYLMCQIQDVTAARGAALALQHSEERSRAIVEMAGDGILTMDEHGRIASFNPAAERIFGYAAGEVLGRRVEMLMPEELREAHGTGVRRYLAGGAPHVVGQGAVDVLGQRADGSVFPLNLTVAEVTVGGERLFTSVLRDVSDQRRAEDELRFAAAEHASLSRVAVAVAAAAEPADVFALIAEEVAALFGVEVGAVVRYGPDCAYRVGTWAHAAIRQRVEAAETVWRPGGASAVMETYATGRFSCVDDYVGTTGTTSEIMRSLSFRSGVAAPILIGGRLWGAITAGSVKAGAFPPETETRLSRFAGLTSLALENAETRSQLVERATNDPLTGLANHRTFHERLRVESQRAALGGAPLALVLLDIDFFKSYNDTQGHQAGDWLVAQVARRLVGVLGEGELAARIGGDEFALLLPGRAAADALALAEQARRAVPATPVGSYGRVTISAGVCDLGEAGSVEALLRYADGALYWAKAHGRDSCVAYDRAIVVEHSADERAARLVRAQALAALRALARAIDAKDASTREHSERVAALAEQLALVLGWSPERAQELREAGLVHDVGKIGVPDAILSKPGRLTPAEYAEIQKHAALGAQIASEVLSDEQTAWIRAHHERPDGRGYPDRLAGSEIPDGARILALADSWDVMTAVRPYKEPRSVASALAECHEHAGGQFDHEVVRALDAVHAAGSFGEHGVSAHAA